MKKVVLILGGVAVAMVTAITLFSWFRLSQAEKDLNAKRTEPARQARWAKKEGEDNPKPEQDVVETKE